MRANHYQVKLNYLVYPNNGPYHCNFISLFLSPYFLISYYFHSTNHDNNRIIRHLLQSLLQRTPTICTPPLRAMLRVQGLAIRMAAITAIPPYLRIFPDPLYHPRPQVID